MTDDIRDDLAYVKALAEEGRDTPLVGGIFYVIWGALIGVASLLVFATGIGLINLGPLAGLWVWVIAIAIGWVLCFYFGKKSHSKPGAATLGNKTAMAVWFAMGMFITAFWLTLMVVHDNYAGVGVPPYFLFNLMFPVVFGLYGVAFYATATAMRTAWLKWITLVAWGCALLSLALMGSAYQLLLGAFGSFACALVPGVIFMRNEPSDIV